MFISSDQYKNQDAEEQQPVDEYVMLGAANEHRTALALKEKSSPTDTIEQTVQEILKKEREIIREAMEDYSFHPALKARWIVLDYMLVYICILLCFTGSKLQSALFTCVEFSSWNYEYLEKHFWWQNTPSNHGFVLFHNDHGTIC